MLLVYCTRIIYSLSRNPVKSGLHDQRLRGQRLFARGEGMMSMRRPILVTLAMAFALAGAAVGARADGALAVPAHGVIGVDEAMLAPQFWIKRLPDAEQVV